MTTSSVACEEKVVATAHVSVPHPKDYLFFQEQPLYVPLRAIRIHPVCPPADYHLVVHVSCVDVRVQQT